MSNQKPWPKDLIPIKHNRLYLIKCPARLVLYWRIVYRIHENWGNVSFNYDEWITS